MGDYDTEGEVIWMKSVSSQPELQTYKLQLTSSLLHKTFVLWKDMVSSPSVMKACENLSSRSRNYVACHLHSRRVAGRRIPFLDCAANMALCCVSPIPWSSSWLIVASVVNYNPDSGPPRYAVANIWGPRFHKHVRHLNWLCTSDKFLGPVFLWNGFTCFRCRTQPFSSYFQLIFPSK